MRRFYISEMDRQASCLARKWGMGIETIDFCRPENMENDGVVGAKQRQLREFKHVSMHAPYYEIFPSAIDPMIRDVAMHRMRQTAVTCIKLGVRRMVVHSGFAPQIYYPQWFVPKSIAFWKEFMQHLPQDFELMLENVLDTRPEYILEVCDGVDDPRLRICLDVGHANAYSDIPAEEWIRMLGHRIGHVHLHNNNGDRDEHNTLDNGTMNISALLHLLDECAPEAAICIECMQAEPSLEFLVKEGYVNEPSL